MTIPLSIPTSGQAFPTNTTTTHGLGGTTIATTATQTFEPLIWTNVVVLNTSLPVSPPPGGLAGNTTLVIARDESLLERGLPASVNWRNNGGQNWLCTIQVSMRIFFDRIQLTIETGPGRLRKLLGFFCYCFNGNNGPHPAWHVEQAKRS